MKINSGNFGIRAKAYDDIRPGYPSKVFSLISSIVSRKNPFILDIGCGTGISTRQLATKMKGVVIGLDVDLQMLNVALGHAQTNVSYGVGDVRNIPYEKGTFDAVTAFTAFHWFTDTKALKDIRRILKKDGVLFVVQPRHTSSFAGDLRLILEKELKRKFKSKYNEGNLLEILEKGGFKITHHQNVKDVNRYTLNQYLVLLQSYSIWNDVPVSDRERMIKILKKHFTGRLEHGFICDTRDVEVIAAVMG